MPTLTSSLAKASADHLLVCPHCAGPLQLEHKSLRCPRKHCFDVARQGYVNLAPGKHLPKGEGPTYDRALWEARSSIASQGFFTPVVNLSLAEVQKLALFPSVFLDAGCGEGSFLVEFCRKMESNSITSLGIDLSVDGVRLAAARFKDPVWCVADLAAIPSPDGVFSTIFNILSPANYAEFLRVLRPGGLILKAIPTARHLVEIRTALGETEDFSNRRVSDHFRTFFPNGTSETVETSLDCHPGNAAAFLTMTPLAWHISAEAKQKFLHNPPRRVTVSLEVLIGKKGFKSES